VVRESQGVIGKGTYFYSRGRVKPEAEAAGLIPD